MFHNWVVHCTLPCTRSLREPRITLSPTDMQTRWARRGCGVAFLLIPRAEREPKLALCDCCRTGPAMSLTRVLQQAVCMACACSVCVVCAR
jgi:hypothetical protein